MLQRLKNKVNPLHVKTDTYPLWSRTTELVGVDINERRSWDWLERTVLPYLLEYHKLNWTLINGSFMAVDAHVYYGVIKHYKPKTIIEIGAGNSTVLASLAVGSGNIYAIDPNPNPVLNGIKVDIITKLVESVSLNFFGNLKAGDILFIDSSHNLTTGGDIVWEYCEILPRLKSGVLVHIHDISLPNPYPSVYHKQGVYYNEQYVLQAMLAHNPRYGILWAGAWMYAKQHEKLIKVFPEIAEMVSAYPLATPSSFWLEVK